MVRLLLLYLHPVVGLGTVALAVYAASLGLRSRLPRRDAAACRARHRALTPWLYALVVASWPAGLVSMWLGRPEIAAAESGHFAVGIGLVALFTLAAILSRWVPRDERARRVHPVVGAVAVLLSGVQIFLGLQLLP